MCVTSFDEVICLVEEEGVVVERMCLVIRKPENASCLGFGLPNPNPNRGGEW